MKGSKNRYFFYTKALYPVYLTLLYILFAQQVSAQPLLSSGEIKKVVIDAGHGGKDPGTVYKTVREKDITLSVALKFGKLIQQHYPSVQVVYTRSKDVFIELDERSRIANRNNADLFISIHVNSVAKGNTASGSETFVMGLHKSSENMAVAQRENAVITYESDFSSKYEGYDPNSPESFIIFSLMQNAHLDQSLQLASLVQQEFGNSPIKVNRGVKQAGFLVLWKTAMPSILVELGFISNEADRKALTSDEHQDMMADDLLKAFGSYKAKYERTVGATSASNATTETATQPEDSGAVAPSEAPTPAASDEVQSSKEATASYRVQIMSIAKKESLTSKIFKGYKGVQVVKVGKWYKYTVGNTAKQEEAAALCKRATKDFPGAFVVAYKDGVLVPVR